MVFRWPIEIDGLPINSMVIFHSYVSHNQMVAVDFRAVIIALFSRKSPQKRISRNPVRFDV